MPGKDDLISGDVSTVMCSQLHIKRRVIVVGSVATFLKMLLKRPKIIYLYELKNMHNNAPEHY